MNIEQIIINLKKYTKSTKKNTDKIIIKTFQKNFLDGYIGITINKIKKTNDFEGFIYIKSSKNIVSPLMYKRLKNLDDAIIYFNKLIYMVENKSSNYIIDSCKAY